MAGPKQEQHTGKSKAMAGDDRGVQARCGQELPGLVEALGYHKVFLGANLKPKSEIRGQSRRKHIPSSASKSPKYLPSFNKYSFAGSFNSEAWHQANEHLLTCKNK